MKNAAPRPGHGLTLHHLANTVTQVQQIKNGRWVLVKESLSF